MSVTRRRCRRDGTLRLRGDARQAAVDEVLVPDGSPRAWTWIGWDRLAKAAHEPISWRITHPSPSVPSLTWPTEAEAEANATAWLRDPTTQTTRRLPLDGDWRGWEAYYEGMTR